MVGHVTAALKGNAWSSTCGKSEQCIEYIVASDPRHGVRVQLGDLRISDGGTIFPVFFFGWPWRGVRILAFSIIFHFFLSLS